MIAVQNHVIPINSKLNALETYAALRQIFPPQSLFLLESLAGPEISLHKSVVGLNPILTVKIEKDILFITGHQTLSQKIADSLGQSEFVKTIDTQQFRILDLKTTFEVLRLIESCFQVKYVSDITLPYHFGFFGCFGFDAVRYIEDLPSVINTNHTKLPETFLSIYENMIYFDLKDHTTYLIQNKIQDVDPFEYGQLEALLHSSVSLPELTLIEPTRVTDTISKAEYLKWTDKALTHIRLGDVYQLQVGHEILIDSTIDPFSVYQQMRKQNPSPFMYFAQFDETTVIGASPELSINLVNQRITIRPIAGTIKRGQTEAEDVALKQELQNNPKERAEHLMLVDLARNDIGRICKVNSLKVTALMITERYSHVFHLVSNVIGELADGLDHYDVIAASFPAGTLTGTPKVKALTLIEETEITTRRLHAG